MTTDLEKSLKACLRLIAKETRRDPADLWQNLIIERFLVRLAQSNYRERFVLKGAVLLSKYIPLGRETKDLDFLAKGISNRVDDLSLIFEEVSKIKLDDGFTFQNVQVDQLAHPHMRYSGAEISAMAYFGEIKRKLSIDIGNIYFQMASLEVKRKMLGSIFPGKLIDQDGKYRTEGMNPALSLILQKTNGLQNEKTEQSR